MPINQIDSTCDISSHHRSTDYAIIVPYKSLLFTFIKLTCHSLFAIITVVVVTVVAAEEEEMVEEEEAEGKP